MFGPKGSDLSIIVDTRVVPGLNPNRRLRTKLTFGLSGYKSAGNSRFEEEAKKIT